MRSNCETQRKTNESSLRSAENENNIQFIQIQLKDSISQVSLFESKNISLLCFMHHNHLPSRVRKRLWLSQKKNTIGNCSPGEDQCWIHFVSVGRHGMSQSENIKMIFICVRILHRNMNRDETPKIIIIFFQNTNQSVRDIANLSVKLPDAQAYQCTEQWSNKRNSIFRTSERATAKRRKKNTFKESLAWNRSNGKRDWSTFSQRIHSRVTNRRQLQMK